MTRTTPWRRMILQSLHIFLTEALTFTPRPWFSLDSFHDSSPGWVLRRDLDLDPVSGEESLVSFPHSPRPVGQDLVPVLERDSKKSVWQRLHDGSDYHHLFLLSRHGASHRQRKANVDYIRNTG